MSTASGVAICRIFGPKWCAQLHGVSRKKAQKHGQRHTAVQMLAWRIKTDDTLFVVVLSPGREVDDVVEMGIFLFFWQLLEGIQRQEVDRDPFKTHQICKRRPPAPKKKHIVASPLTRSTGPRLRLPLTGTECSRVVAARSSSALD